MVAAGHEGITGAMQIANVDDKKTGEKERRQCLRIDFIAFLGQSATRLMSLSLITAGIPLA